MSDEERTGPLTEEERRRFKQLEKVVRDGLPAALETYRALKEIERIDPKDPVLAEFQFERLGEVFEIVDKAQRAAGNP